MTNIEITMNDPRYTIRFEGHATGSAEVCAGISALMYSLEGFLRNNPWDIFIHSSQMDNPGFGYIMFELEDPSPKVKGAFELVVIGLQQIEKSYPDYCKVEVKDLSEK